VTPEPAIPVLPLVPLAPGFEPPPVPGLPVVPELPPAPDGPLARPGEEFGSLPHAVTRSHSADVTQPNRARRK